MSDEPALLAAILAFPDEDTPRLVYADWLQEHGDEARAEFIRVQCELASPHAANHMGDGELCADCAHYGRLRTRERELLCGGAIGPNKCPNAVAWSDLPALRDGSAWWLGNFYDDDSEYNCRYVFDRGFVTQLTLPAADWLHYADAITAAHPVRHVRLTTVPDLVAFLGRSGRKCGFIGAPDREWWQRVLNEDWPGVEFELPDLNPWRDLYPAIPDATLPPLLASPELLDAMAVAGLEEQAPVTPGQWNTMWQNLLNPPTE